MIEDWLFDSVCSDFWFQTKIVDISTYYISIKYIFETVEKTWHFEKNKYMNYDYSKSKNQKTMFISYDLDIMRVQVHRRFTT